MYHNLKMLAQQHINAFKNALVLLVLTGFTYACKNDASTTTSSANPTAPEITQESFKKSEGDCEKNCADFELHYPVIKTGSPALREAVKNWVENSVAEMCAQTEDGTIPKMTIDQASATFIDQWKSSQSELPYEFDLKDSVLMCNAQYVTLRLDIYMYTGGAHPNYFTKLAIFDATNGTIVPKSTFINDEQAILPLLDMVYKSEKSEAFAAGNAYMDGHIIFPEQCAFTENGVLFHYNTYEIAPYALGDADIFMTWTDLGNAATKLIK
jgi:hypothetical protein